MKLVFKVRRKKTFHVEKSLKTKLNNVFKLNFLTTSKRQNIFSKSYSESYFYVHRKIVCKLNLHTKMMEKLRFEVRHKNDHFVCFERKD